MKYPEPANPGRQMQISGWLPEAGGWVEAMGELFFFGGEC